MDFRIIKNTIKIGIIGSFIFLGACRSPVDFPGYQYMPDMYVGPAEETYGPRINNIDSTSALLPVAGTIPRGFTFFNFPNTLEGYELASVEAKNPLASDSINLAEGKRMFEIYCINCHGAEGKGDGSIVAAGKFPPPPSYSTGNSSRGGLMKDLTDGKIYHTITYGINLMGSHAAQIAPMDRWRIVMYVHELQKNGAPATTAAVDSSATAVK